MKKKRVLTSILTLIILALTAVSGYVVKNWEIYFPPASFDEGTNISSEEISSLANETFKENQVISVNNQVPVFTQEELSLKEGMWQKFSDLDSLNRVGEANAMLHNSMMPKVEREALYVNPTGWKNKKTKTGWLYNRAHLIGFQLSGENNNPKNLMTATRSLNTPCMLEYENRVADYLHETNNHVRYRVTPVFKDDELQFHVYIFNVEEDMEINYQDGTSKVERKGD
ncbi:DNA/RNA non-specific endonuclease [Listeria welshimeri]|nr:DNA/RNA non-specific endonuclease [Listeria welshimeri]